MDRNKLMKIIAIIIISWCIVMAIYYFYFMKRC